MSRKISPYVSPEQELDDNEETEDGGMDQLPNMPQMIIEEPDDDEREPLLSPRGVRRSSRPNMQSNGVRTDLYSSQADEDWERRSRQARPILESSTDQTRSHLNRDDVNLVRRSRQTMPSLQSNIEMNQPVSSSGKNTKTSVRPNIETSQIKPSMEDEDWERKSKQSKALLKPSARSSRGSAYSNLDDEDFINKLPSKRPSLLLPSLQEYERRFLDLVASGNMSAVKEFLQENHGFNINCVNFQGLSALHQAVLNGSEPMAMFLLQQQELDVGDCALHAVRENQARILSLILDRQHATSPQLEMAGCTDSADFPDGTTPLLLAAQCGHYEIIAILIDRGHSIRKPHPVTCFCPEVCQVELKQKDGLSVANARINLYRAHTSPAYLCHSSDDPILTAFQLCRELYQWSKHEREFHTNYVELAHEVRLFAAELIAACRTSEEVELILRRRAGCAFPGQFMFPRLMLAMDYNQKEFVAHSNTQQVLEAAWHGDWYKWRAKSELAKTLAVIPHIAILPIITIMCMVLPGHRLVRKYQVPVRKMLSNVASYLVFLTFVFLESNIDKTSQKRGPPQSGLEGVLIVYVTAYCWSSVRLCMLQGPKRFFSVLTNWYDVVTQLLFIFTFLFWLAALLEVRANDQGDLERKYWHHMDPTLIAEGFFAVATIMAFGRLLLLCQLNYYLGPLQVSLGKMAKDIAKYLVIFTILLLSFCAGLCRLYQYYDGMVQEDSATGSSAAQVSSFVSFEKTLKTLFWAIFCMSPIESADVVIENLKGPTESSTIINHHVFTEVVGHISFALFEVMSVVVILNMLIATMSNTFQKVTDNVMVEWTFGRTEMYLRYMSQTTLPPPFNLAPTPKGMQTVLQWFKLLSNPVPGKKARFSPTHCCYVEMEGEDEEMQKDFPVLMAQLAQRYFREKELQAEDEEGSSELNTLRQETNELRTMLQDLLAQNKR